jgi:Transcription factor WhiB
VKGDDRDTLAYVLTFGACRGMDTNLFFPSDPDQEPPAVCSTCPVVDECFSWGLHYEDNGCWGGVSETGLRQLRAMGGIEIEPIPGSTPDPDPHGQAGKA